MRQQHSKMSALKRKTQSRASESKENGYTSSTMIQKADHLFVNVYAAAEKLWITDRIREIRVK